jgi:hypothetical protein
MHLGNRPTYDAPPLWKKSDELFVVSDKSRDSCVVDSRNGRQIWHRQTVPWSLSALRITHNERRCAVLICLCEAQPGLR